MKTRVAKLAALGTLAAAAVTLLYVASGLSLAQTIPQRTPFLIATGPSGGTYFPVGQTIAGIISNPPGVDRCQVRNACGPAGLIASARTSDGAVANVLAVNAGNVDSGLAQADVVADATRGVGAFRKSGKQTHVQVLAGLFAEDVHLVAATKSRIRAMNDLKGKRVSIGADDFGTNVTARAILAAYGLSSRNVQTAYDSVDDEVEDIQQGKLDAFFFVGATPVPLLSDLIARGVVRLVPVDGKGRQRLMKAVPDIEPAAIPANTYAGTGSVETVRVRAIWIVRDSTPNPLTYGILRALFAPANRTDLDSAMPATHAIRLENAARDLPAPLHPGAMRFFRETGNFSPPAKPGKI